MSISVSKSVSVSQTIAVTIAKAISITIMSIVSGMSIVSTIIPCSGFGISLSFGVSLSLSFGATLFPFLNNSGIFSSGCGGGNKSGESKSVRGIIKGIDSGGCSFGTGNYCTTLISTYIASVNCWGMVNYGGCHYGMGIVPGFSLNGSKQSNHQQEFHDV